jgi:hypothetical protein
LVRTWLPKIEVSKCLLERSTEDNPETDLSEPVPMKMYYYRASRPNFGDELNVWLWSRLLPNFFDEDESTLFLGIGSILFDYHPRNSRKIVFGSGYGAYTPSPVIDDRWQVYFVRGRLTANALGVDQKLALGDAAILLRSCIGLPSQRRHAVSFMPHWESAIDGAWPEVCKAAGIHYIDPCASVDQVLADITSSGLVVTEAMHGAIVSDALRIPWIPIAPIQGEHRMKWYDWASALELPVEPSRLGVSSAFEWALATTKGNRKWAGRIRKRAQALRGLARGYFIQRAAESLTRIARMTPSLSADTAIERAHGAMMEKLEILRRKR